MLKKMDSIEGSGGQNPGVFLDEALRGQQWHWLLPVALDASHTLAGYTLHGTQEATTSAPTPEQPELHQWSWRGLEDPSSRVCSALRSQARGTGLSGLHARSLSRTGRDGGTHPAPQRQCGARHLLVLQVSGYYGHFP